MAIDIQNVTAVQNEQQQGIIGNLTWYSVSEHLVSREKLHNKLIDSGLDEGWMPNEIRCSDAFRRATKSIETRKATTQSNIFENYLVREVYSDKNMIQRKKSSSIVAQELAQEAEKLFNIYKNIYSTQTFRVLCMNITKSMSPTPVEPNGRPMTLNSLKTTSIRHRFE